MVYDIEGLLTSLLLRRERSVEHHGRDCWRRSGLGRRFLCALPTTVLTCFSVNLRLLPHRRQVRKPGPKAMVVFHRLQLLEEPVLHVRSLLYPDQRAITFLTRLLPYSIATDHASDQPARAFTNKAISTPGGYRSVALADWNKVSR